jgi:hypothetical protein
MGFLSVSGEDGANVAIAFTAAFFLRGRNHWLRACQQNGRAAFHMQPHFLI